MNKKTTLLSVAIIIFSAVIGAGIFSFVAAKNLYFPNIKQTANDGGAGLFLTAFQYDPWLWNREKTTIINIEDRKNDAPNVQYKLKGDIYIRLIHSGENFALIAYNEPNSSLVDSGYVVHRSPKSESENTIDKIHVNGNIIAVAPDESGYFYISGNNIFKSNWQGDTIISADLETDIDPILDVQQISMAGKSSRRSVLFFSNNTKMAFLGTILGERWDDGYLFIWDLQNNRIEKINRKDIGGYNDLMVEDDKLYVEKTDSSTSKKFIAQ